MSTVLNRKCLLVKIISFLIIVTLPVPVFAQEAYYTDQQFEEYSDRLLSRYGTDRQDESLQKLLQFIYGKRCTYEQVHSILEQGYLTEYIDEMKVSGVLEKDYTLPSGVDVKDCNIDFVEGGSDEYYEEMSAPEHEFKDLSIENQNKIAELLYNDDRTDAYVMLPDSIEDKKLIGDIVSLSLYNGEQLSINFTEGDNIKYGVTFWNNMGPEGGYIDLSIDSDTDNGGHLKYDLGVEGDVTLHLAVDPDRDYSLIKDGSIVTTVTPETTDTGCYVTLEVPSKGDFTVKREKIRIEGEGKDNVNNPDPVWVKPIDLNKWPVLIAGVIVILAGIGLIIYGFIRKR